MNNKKNIILLGSTGSIGESSLRLIRNNREQFNLLGVSAHNNAKLLSEIVNEFDVPNVVLSNSKMPNLITVNLIKCGSIQLD